MTDVSNQLNQIRGTYGGSDLSNPEYFASSKSLNLSSSSNSIQNATGPTITTVPFKLSLEDTVGLFGAENFYVKVTLDITDTGNNFTTVNDYSGAISSEDVQLLNTYTTASEDDTLDLAPVNDFEPSKRGRGFDELIEPIISVSLNNVGTGNIYNDSHIDARLYDKTFKEISDYETLANKKSVFYLGVHCRNTRRIPYNIEIDIGDSITVKSELSENLRRTIIP